MKVKVDKRPLKWKYKIIIISQFFAPERVGHAYATIRYNYLISNPVSKKRPIQQKQNGSKTGWRSCKVQLLIYCQNTCILTSISKKKVQKLVFSAWKWSNSPIWGPKFDPKFWFRGHIATFRAENKPKSGPFQAENNAQTTSKQLQNKFQKVQKTWFLTPKMVKMTLSEGQNLT